METPITVYIDSDVFVSSEINNEPHHDESLSFMEYVLKEEHPDITFYTSIFTFVELASAMMRRTKNKDKAYSLLYRIRNSWKESIHPLPLSINKRQSIMDTIDQLVESTLNFNTRTGDTIQAHTFAINDINIFVTWNIKDFYILQEKIENVKVLTPKEALGEFNKIDMLSRKRASLTNFEFSKEIKELLENLIEKDLRNDSVHSVKGPYNKNIGIQQYGKKPANFSKIHRNKRKIKGLIPPQLPQETLSPHPQKRLNKK
ncbi:MAG: hypothetical protein M1544_00540 [Candidatus Marsarchaeota archaeon]|nr:hypothetical protein [Candidatus Marsarchaeota archaeon]